MVVPLEEMRSIIGHRFPGGTYRIEHWENFLMHDVMLVEQSPDKIAHPLYFFHLPIAGLGVTIQDIFVLCRADSPEDAIANLQDGDVLVVPCTTPAYNMVLSMAGAVVTAEGGVLSHAAVLARELGIPAVIGAPKAMTELRDGMIVDIDAAAGEIRIVASN